MNPIKQFYCRVFQAVFHAALPILPYREPKVFSKVQELAPLFKDLNIQSVLLVTDKRLRGFGIT